MRDYLTSGERTRLEELRRRDVFVQDVLAQVDRILASLRFERLQQHARDFLAYVVAKVLLGEGEHIKETTIAVAVFDEPADFDPAESAKIRVAGADLRARLDAYAEHVNSDDPVTIRLPSSTYVPAVVDQRVTIEIIGFENWNPQDEQEHLRRAFVSEVVYRFREAGCRVSEGPTIPVGQNRRCYVLRGSLECRESVLHVNLSLADPGTGRIVSSQSLEDDRDAVLRVARVAFEALRDALAKADSESLLSPVRARTRRHV